MNKLFLFILLTTIFVSCSSSDDDYSDLGSHYTVKDFAGTWYASDIKYTNIEADEETTEFLKKNLNDGSFMSLSGEMPFDLKLTSDGFILPGKVHLGGYFTVEGNKITFMFESSHGTYFKYIYQIVQVDKKSFYIKHDNASAIRNFFSREAPNPQSIKRVTITSIYKK